MNICITGGGTGGHLVIAQSLLEAAKIRGHYTIFIGSTSGQDMSYFAKDSMFDEVYFLDTSGVVDKKGLKKLRSLWLSFKAFLKSIKLLKKHSIDAIYSVGGFSAAPASFASLAINIPLYIHEQNAVYGRLNRLLKPYAKSFISAYDNDSSIKAYPVRDIFFNKQRVRSSIKTIIFLGGSQGAKAINDLALSVAKELSLRGVKIIHQTGQRDFERVVKEYERLEIEAEIFAFSKDIVTLMDRADLAVSRSGASTLWELCAIGLPAFFIPYPYAASNHQYYNAKFIVDNYLGWCELEGIGLKDRLLSILDENLADKSKKLISYSQNGVALKMIEQLEQKS